jgi:uncharacterized protein (TIGR03067 family)
MTPLLLGLAIGIGAPAVKDPPKKDPPSIVGEWVPQSAVIGGKNDPPPAGTTFEFTKDGKAIMKEPGSKGDEMNYSVDLKKDPMEIDLKESAGMKEMVMPGILKIDGDTLTICIAMVGERPKTFASPANSNNMLITMKRAKKD